MKAFLSVILSVCLKIRTLFDSKYRQRYTLRTVTKNLNGGSMQDVVVLETQFTLGSLVVWAAVSQEQLVKGLARTHYFWKDAGSPQGFGPFNYISTTMEHYKSIVQTMKDGAQSQRKTGQIIQVDFTAKRRLY